MVVSLDTIIKGCLNNRRTSQKQLYELFSAKMYGICMRYAKNHHDAQDILQEGFILVFEKLHTLKNVDSIEGWIRRIIINTAVKKYREKISYLWIDKEDDEIVERDNHVDYDQLEFDDLIDLIQLLPAQYRIVFNMYAIEGYSHKEISNVLNISDSTSRSNYLRARNILKDMLIENNKLSKYSEIVLK